MFSISSTSTSFSRGLPLAAPRATCRGQGAEGGDEVTPQEAHGFSIGGSTAAGCAIPRGSPLPPSARALRNSETRAGRQVDQGVHCGPGRAHVPAAKQRLPPQLPALGGLPAHRTSSASIFIQSAKVTGRTPRALSTARRPSGPAANVGVADVQHCMAPEHTKRWRHLSTGHAARSAAQPCPAKRQG